MKILFVFGF